MKFKFWKYFVGLVIVSLFLFVANVVCVLVRKHDVCFNRSGECLWLFKQKDKVDTTMQVQQVGVNDIFLSALLHIQCGAVDNIHI